MNLCSESLKAVGCNAALNLFYQLLHCDPVNALATYIICDSCHSNKQSDHHHAVTTGYINQGTVRVKSTIRDPKM